MSGRLWHPFWNCPDEWFQRFSSLRHFYHDLPCNTAQNKLPAFNWLQLWSEKGVVACHWSRRKWLVRLTNSNGRECWVRLRRHVGWQKGDPFLAIIVPHQGKGCAWAKVPRGEVCPQNTFTSLFFVLSHLPSRHSGPSMGRKQGLGRVSVGTGRRWEARLLLFCILLAGGTISLIDWSKSKNMLHESPCIHEGCVSRPQWMPETADSAEPRTVRQSEISSLYSEEYEV